MVGTGDTQENVMGEIAVRMAEDLRLRNYSHWTQYAYLRSARAFVAFYMKPPTELGEKEIRSFLSWLVAQKGISGNGLRKFVGGIKFLYRVTLNQPEVVERLPWPRHPKHLPPVPSAEQISALMRTAEGDARLLAHLMLGYGAGLRVSEACRVRIQDVDSARGVLHIHGGKGNKDRITVLCPRLLAALRAWWKVGRPAGPWLFPGRVADKPITVAAMNTHFVRARKRAGLPEWFTFHSLRHAFATHLLESGLDILTIQGLLGHSQLKTTLTYLRVRTAHIQKVRSPLEDLDLTPK